VETVQSFLEERVDDRVFFDEEIGESGCIYYTAIDDPQWQLVVVCYDFEVYDKVYKMRLNSLWMLLFSCLLIGFIIYRMFRHPMLTQGVIDRIG